VVQFGLTVYNRHSICRTASDEIAMNGMAAGVSVRSGYATRRCRPVCSRARGSRSYDVFRQNMSLLLRWTSGYACIGSGAWRHQLVSGRRSRPRRLMHGVQAAGERHPTARFGCCVPNGYTITRPPQTSRGRRPGTTSPIGCVSFSRHQSIHARRCGRGSKLRDSEDPETGDRAAKVAQAPAIGRDILAVEGSDA
jgi:hypothetical protein